MSRLSTDIYALSGTFEPYSELEMRCLKYGDEVRKMEDDARRLKQRIEYLNDQLTKRKVEGYKEGVRDTELRLNVITEDEAPTSRFKERTNPGIHHEPHQYPDALEAGRIPPFTSGEGIVVNPHDPYQDRIDAPIKLKEARVNPGKHPCCFSMAPSMSQGPIEGDNCEEEPTNNDA